MQITNLERVLNQGCHFYIFNNVNNSRVVEVSLDGNFVAKGCGAKVEEAIGDALINYQNKESCNYKRQDNLSGYSSIKKKLDLFLVEGGTIKAYKSKGEFVVELNDPSNLSNKTSIGRSSSLIRSISSSLFYCS